MKNENNIIKIHIIIIILTCFKMDGTSRSFLFRSLSLTCNVVRLPPNIIIERFSFLLINDGNVLRFFEKFGIGIIYDELLVSATIFIDSQFIDNGDNRNNCCCNRLTSVCNTRNANSCTVPARFLVKSSQYVRLCCC